MSIRSLAATLLAVALSAPACGTTPALVPLTPTERGALLAARSTRLDLARFGPVVPTVVMHDGQRWLAFRKGEGVALLSPARPPRGDEPTCRRELPEGGGFFWFDAAPLAALHLDERASLRWYDPQRDCWTFGELRAPTEGPVIELGSASVVRPSADGGEPMVPTTLALTGPILPDGTRLEVSGAGALRLSLWAPRPRAGDDDDPPEVVRLGEVDLTPALGEAGSTLLAEVDSWARDLRVRATRRRGSADWLVIVVWQEARRLEGTPSSPWLASEARWTLIAGGGRVRPLRFHATQRWGPGDADRREVHVTHRAEGDSPLARGWLRRSIRVDAPPGERTVSPDGERRVVEARAADIDWEILPADGSGRPLRLWPSPEPAEPPTELPCGPPPALQQDLTGDWLPRPGRRGPALIWDAAAWLARRAGLADASRVDGLPGVTRWTPLGCGWLLHREITLEARRASGEAGREAAGSAEVDLLLDPISGATRVLRSRRDARWTVPPGEDAGAGRPSR